MHDVVKDTVAELLALHGYAETVITLRCEFSVLTQEDAEEIVNEVCDEIGYEEE